jgi:hypothetical protein
LCNKSCKTTRKTSPVGSKPLPMAKLVQRKPEDHETVKHRVPFLITTYFVIAWILAAALTKEYSPESCLASSSLIVITSTLSLQVTLAMRNPSKIHGI